MGAASSMIRRSLVPSGPVLISKETHLKVIRITYCIAVIEFDRLSVRPSSPVVLLAGAVIQAFYESRFEFATLSIPQASSTREALSFPTARHETRAARGRISLDTTPRLASTSRLIGSFLESLRPASPDRGYQPAPAGPANSPGNSGWSSARFMLYRQL